VVCEWSPLQTCAAFTVSSPASAARTSLVFIVRSTHSTSSISRKKIDFIRRTPALLEDSQHQRERPSRVRTRFAESPMPSRRRFPKLCREAGPRDAPESESPTTQHILWPYFSGISQRAGPPNLHRPHSAPEPLLRSCR